MADRRETYAGLLSGDMIGKTITVPDRDGDGDGDLVDDVVRVIVHQAGDVVALFIADETLPCMVAADAIAVVSVSEQVSYDLGQMHANSADGDRAGLPASGGKVVEATVSLEPTDPGLVTSTVDHPHIGVAAGKAEPSVLPDPLDSVAGRGRQVGQGLDGGHGSTVAGSNCVSQSWVA